MNTWAAQDGRLWLAIRCADLPQVALGLECDHSAQTARVVTEKNAVVSANGPARHAGVTYGMDITTARLLSNCEVHERDPAQEHTWLAQLMERLYAFTPHLELYETPALSQAGVLLEISRCLLLFGGVQSLCCAIHKALDSNHQTLFYGLAHTSKGAWLLSFAPHHLQFEATGIANLTVVSAALLRERCIEQLASLPISVLGDYPDSLEALAKTGFSTLGDVLQQIRRQHVASIKKRLGGEFMQLIYAIFGLDQSLQQPGLFSPPVGQYQPRDYFNDQWQFDFPVTTSGQLEWPMQTLLQRLSHYLQRRQWQCQRIEWQLRDIYQRQEIMTVHSDQPQSHWKLLLDLSLIQLENRPLPFEVDTLTLQCVDTQPLQLHNSTLEFRAGRKKRAVSAEFAVTLAKLKARLGDAAVHKLSYHDSLIPESSNHCIALQQRCQQTLPPVHQVALRPAWLFAQPQPIDVRKEGLYWQGRLQLMIGPERIQGEWWESTKARDYFLAQRQDQIRLWIYVDLYTRQWFVQGVFA